MAISSVNSAMHFQYQLNQSQRDVLSAATQIAQAGNQKVSDMKDSLMLYTIEGNQRTAGIQGRMIDTFA